MSDFVYEIFVEKAKIATVAKGELINNVPDLIGEVNPGQIINFFIRKMRVVEKTVRVDELIIELYLKQISESMTYGILRENLENIVLGYRKGGARTINSQEVVELHGGQVNVTSKVGKGSAFVIKLPIRRS